MILFYKALYWKTWTFQNLRPTELFYMLRMAERDFDNANRMYGKYEMSECFMITTLKKQEYLKRLMDLGIPEVY